MPHKVLMRAGFALLLTGAALFIATSMLNRRAVWLPLVESLPLVAHEPVAFEFVPSRDGIYEVQIEADDTVGEDVRKRFLTTTVRPAELDVMWAVTRGGEAITAGESRGYVYVEWGSPSWLRRLRRVLLRIPYCQNARQWMTLGLAGSTTSARGVGRFQAQAGSRYTIEVTPAAEHPELEAGNVQLVVRPDRRRWNAHFASTRTLGYTALLAFGLGGGLLALGMVLVPRAARS